MATSGSSSACMTDARTSMSCRDVHNHTRVFPRYCDKLPILRVVAVISSRFGDASADTGKGQYYLTSQKQLIIMYDKQNSFVRQPFSAIPDVTGYYPAESIEKARKTIERVLENASGIPLVFGETGTGKSLLLRLIERQYAENWHAVYLANQRLRSPKALYQHLLFAVHQSFCGLEENELRLLFLDYLRQDETCVIVLLIDEAHFICRSVFEELRVLMHYNDESCTNVRFVLAGDHRFEEHLTHPHLAAFQQHVVARCYLENFRWAETEAEIIWQLKQAGVDRPESVFVPDARKAVHRLSEGLPRLVHQLCHQSLAIAVASKAEQIDEPLVQAAWRRLQQLPEDDAVNSWQTNETPVQHFAMPVSVTTQDNGTESIIEFGSLEDESTLAHDRTVYHRPVFDDADVEADNDATFACETQGELTEPNAENADTEYVIPYCPFSRESDAVLCDGDTEVSSIGRNTLVIGNGNTPGFVTLGEALSDKNVKLPERIVGESCQKLLDELSLMEHLLTQEINVINKMKKIESDCLARRVRCGSAAQILASFPEMSNSR